MAKKGILLINVGSPDDPSPESVGRYLNEFLMDPKVISAPWPIRAVFVKFLIVPKRAHSSAEKYQKVWTQQGSPLLVESYKFAEKLQSALGEKALVQVGMRYASPSLSSALEVLKNSGVTELLICPLYPQFAQASTQTSVEQVRALLKDLKWDVPNRVLPPFFREPGFIDSFAATIGEKNPKDFQHVLFSFHGLPENQIKKVKGCQATDSCCLQPGACEKNCYRAQAIKTASLLAQKLELGKNQWSYSFQSRLGPVQWIKPYTDEVIPQLLARGVKSLLVACPSFVTDCLETLEEIGLGAKDDFLKAGGENFALASCPNSSDLWVKSFATMIEKV